MLTPAPPLVPRRCVHTILMVGAELWARKSSKPLVHRIVQAPCYLGVEEGAGSSPAARPASLAIGCIFRPFSVLWDYLFGSYVAKQSGGATVVGDVLSRSVCSDC